MIRKNIFTCAPRERLADVKSRRRGTDDLCIVVNDRNIVLGVIRGDAWNGNPQARISDVMHAVPCTIRPHLELNEAQNALRNYDWPSAIVTTADGELIGIVKISHKRNTALENERY